MESPTAQAHVSVHVSETYQKHVRQHEGGGMSVPGEVRMEGRKERRKERSQGAEVNFSSRRN